MSHTTFDDIWRRRKVVLWPSRDACPCRIRHLTTFGDVAKSYQMSPGTTLRRRVTSARRRIKRINKPLWDSCVQNSYTFEGVSSFQGETAKLSCDFKRMPQSAWELIYENFHAVACSSSASDEEQDLLCHGCGIVIDLAIDDSQFEGKLTGDACDKCGDIHHV